MDFAFIGWINGLLVKKKSQEESIILSKQNSLYHDFKIRWSKNDGSGLFFDAISKNICCPAC
jgi:hypothetical protein